MTEEKWLIFSRTAASYCAQRLIMHRGLLLFDSTGGERGLFIKFTGPGHGIFWVVHSMCTAGF